jgi:hypothetical protein
MCRVPVAGRPLTAPVDFRSVDSVVERPLSRRGRKVAVRPLAVVRERPLSGGTTVDTALQSFPGYSFAPGTFVQKPSAAVPSGDRSR